MIDRQLIRKLIGNIIFESKHINTIMEIADQKNSDSAIALSQEELREIVLLLSQTDYLLDYLKEQEILKGEEKAEDNTDTRWIPVNERLPEAHLDVLVCNSEGDIEISDGCYSTEIPDEWIWITTNWRFGDVIAWRPLPEPWETKCH